MDRTGEQARRQDVRESSEMAQILPLFLGSTKRSRLRGPGGRHVSMPPGMRTRERERERGRDALNWTEDMAGSKGESHAVGKGPAHEWMILHPSTEYDVIHPRRFTHSRARRTNRGHLLRCGTKGTRPPHPPLSLTPCHNMQCEPECKTYHQEKRWQAAERPSACK